MPEIEFVDPEPQTGADEELAQGPRHGRPPSAHPARMVIAALAVLAAVVAVGTLARHGGSRHAAAPTTTAVTTGGTSPNGSAPVTFDQDIPVLPTAGFTESITTPTCVGLAVSRCRVDLRVPSGVRRAIEAQFGAVSHLRVATVSPARGATTVRRRTVASQAGEDNVQIDIRPASAGERARSGTSYVGAFATVYATELQHGVAVSVSVSGVQTQTPSVVSVTALAADRRLLAAD